MSFTPNKQYTEGNDVSTSPIGPLVQTRDSVTGLAVPLTLGKEGVDQSTLGTGVLGWLKALSDSVGVWSDAGQSLAALLQQIASTINTVAAPLYTFNSDGSSVKGIALFCRENQSSNMFPLQTDGKSLFVTDPTQALALDPDVKTINTGTYATVVASNSTRLIVFLRNNSTSGQTVWLSFNGTPPTIGKGISLKPTETYELDAHCTGVIYGQADADGALVSVQEWDKI